MLKSDKFFVVSQKLYGDATQIASDAVGSIRTVSSFCAEEKVLELHQEKCVDPVRLGIRQGILTGAAFGLSFFFLYTVYATSFYAGARLVDAGKTTFADVFRVSFRTLTFWFLVLCFGQYILFQSGYS